MDYSSMTTLPVVEILIAIAAIGGSIASLAFASTGVKWLLNLIDGAGEPQSYIVTTQEGYEAYLEEFAAQQAGPLMDREDADLAQEDAQSEGAEFNEAYYNNWQQRQEFIKAERGEY